MRWAPWGSLLVVAHDEGQNLQRAQACVFALGAIRRFLGGSWVGLDEIVSLLATSPHQYCVGVDFFLTSLSEQYTTDSWSVATITQRHDTFPQLINQLAEILSNYSPHQDVSLETEGRDVRLKGDGLVLLGSMMTFLESIN